MTCILIIEDDPNIREHIAEVLEYEGYAVLQAENGLVGVESALNALPDLIFCDVMMPKMDGYGVLLALRGQPTTRSIPFIFLTAKADRLSVRQGMELGVDDYLTKPYTLPEVLAAVSSCLEKRDSMDRLHQQSFDDLRMNLVRMLPHELRTPLIGILGYGEIMSTDYESLAPQEIRAMGETITTEGHRLQHLIENYFLYVQIELAMHNAPARAAFANGQLEMPGGLIREIALAKAAQSERGK